MSLQDCHSSCLAKLITDVQLQIPRTSAFHTAIRINLLHVAMYLFATNCTSSGLRFQSVDDNHNLQGMNGASD